MRKCRKRGVEKPRTFVLIDLSYLTYRALYTMGDLEYDDVPTGILFGFFNQLYTICTDSRVRSVDIHIFIDSRLSFRKEVYPEYKEHRVKNQDPDFREKVKAMREQMDELARRILPGCGFATYEQDGIESDDLMAWAARRINSNALLSGCDHRAVIVTGDHDLYQCLTDRVSCFDSQRDKYMTRRMFLEAHHVEPWRFGEVKAISGCKSDNVKGIVGVGENTAFQFLKGDLAPNTKRYQKIVSPEGQRIRERNRPLVVLPHAQTKPFKLQRSSINLKRFRDLCERKGLQSFLAEWTKWRRFFQGVLFRQPDIGGLLDG